MASNTVTTTLSGTTIINPQATYQWGHSETRSGAKVSCSFGQGQPVSATIPWESPNPVPIGNEGGAVWVSGQVQAQWESVGYCVTFLGRMTQANNCAIIAEGCLVAYSDASKEFRAAFAKE